MLAKELSRPNIMILTRKPAVLRPTTALPTFHHGSILTNVNYYFPSATTISSVWRRVQTWSCRKYVWLLGLRRRLTKALTRRLPVHQPLGTGKQSLWPTVVTCLAYRPGKPSMREALRFARPAIVNTDQGGQFTNGVWIETLSKAGVAISRDGWLDTSVSITRIARTRSRPTGLQRRFTSGAMAADVTM